MDKKRHAATEIVQRLREHSFKAYFVGGCVRDLVMGLDPKDYDITTDATPDQVMALFPEGLTVGAQFGVVAVPRESGNVEVATFRSDGLYADGRHPNEVRYAKTPKEDVLRRDFTINGLMMDPETREVLIRRLAGVGESQIEAYAVGGLLIASTIVIGAALARFKRGKLVFD